MTTIDRKAVETAVAALNDMTYQEYRRQIDALVQKNAREAMMRQYRCVNPRSRTPLNGFRYYHNGSIVRQRQCVLCGARGPSWCGRWPKTLRAGSWEYFHVCKHMTSDPCL